MYYKENVCLAPIYTLRHLYIHPYLQQINKKTFDSIRWETINFLARWRWRRRILPSWLNMAAVYTNLCVLRCYATKRQQQQEKAQWIFQPNPVSQFYNRNTLYNIGSAFFIYIYMRIRMKKFVFDGKHSLFTIEICSNIS